MAYEFEWDPKKAAANEQKHGVSFQEATTVFADPFAMNMSDPDHSLDEQRFVLLGLSNLHRLLVVAYTERPPRTRIISARSATHAERTGYEEDPTQKT